MAPEDKRDKRDEATRLAALREYNLLDTDPEAVYDDLTQLAALVCGTPFATVTLIDADRQWFKSVVGLDVRETPRDVSFCAHAILQSEMMIVPDAAQDPRFAGNPYVTGAPYIRFYAGVPLITLEGHALGALCVIDQKPRQLSPAQEAGLRTLARQVVSRIETTRQAVVQTRLTVEREQLSVEREQLSVEREQLSVERENLTVEREKTFLRDVLASVTEGKLLLVRLPLDLPAALASLGEPIPLTRGGGLRGLRQRAQAAAQAAGHSEERQHDLLTAASEAGMNAILHGGGGLGQVSAGADGLVQVRVVDQGGGIAMETLPRAALVRGFSTQATLGHGLKMMLETVDRLFLLTDTAGTTVVLEQNRDKPLPAWV